MSDLNAVNIIVAASKVGEVIATLLALTPAGGFSALRCCLSSIFLVFSR
jgi:hypothetical protein